MEKLTAMKVCQQLDIAPQTLNNWYKWYSSSEFKKPEGMPELPPYEQAGPRAPRFWSEEAVEQLRVFKEWIPKGRGGVMGSYTARFWGSRGKRALKNKKGE